MGLFDIFKNGLTASDRKELDAKYVSKDDMPKPYVIPEGYSLLSKEQAEKLDKLENYKPPKEYTAKYVLVKQDGKSTPMELEVFKAKPDKLPENQINIIL